MCVPEYLLEEPVDDYAFVESIVKQACDEFVERSYKTGRFEDLYDLMFEEIRENIHKYLPEVD